MAQLLPWQLWVLRLGKLAFVILLAIELANFTWRIVAPEPLVLMAPSQSGSKITQSTGVGVAQYHLFGEAGKEPIRKVTEEVSAPETRLRLELLGVTKSVEHKELSTAIIAPKGSAGEFYRVGDTIQGGTRLAAVYENRVILDTNGKLETLKFEIDSNSGVETRRVATPEPRPTGSNLRERFRSVNNPTQFMNMVTDEATTDPEGTISQLGLESVGSGEGYRVQEGSMLQALELQAGDIIISVNGHALGDPSTDQALLQQVSSEGRARIEVQRGDNRFVVNHSLQ